MLKTFCFVLLISLCSSSDSSSLIHRLFNKRSNAPPVILVLDKNTLRPLVDQHSHITYDSSEENSDTLQHLIKHLSKFQRSKSRSHNHNKGHQHDRHSRVRDYLEHEDKTKNVDRTENKVDDLVSPKSVLRSPIFKSLLTLRNSLQCGARDECQSECGDSFKGSKKNKCEDKCEKKFECKQPKEDDRQCGNSCEDSEEPPNECGANQCQGSTKGVLNDPEPVGCKRC